MRNLPPLPLDMLKPGAILAGGRYRLIRQLRIGGNGVVWLAQHVAMGLEVVIKFPRHWTRGSGSRDKQLECEIQSLIAFSSRHPNIVNVLDVGEHAGRRFIVTQFMQNGSLQEFCYRPDRVLLEKASAALRCFTWLGQVGSALDYIHHAGLIHCDVKPANVLLDDSFSAYLADFGIATIDCSNGGTEEICQDDQNCILGSLPYIAPELFARHAATAASDQFALGVTVYEFVFGTIPFDGNCAVDVFNSQKKIIDAWSKHKSIPGLSGSVGVILRRAMSADPNLRFPNCSQFAAELIDIWKDMPLVFKANSVRPSDTKPNAPSSTSTPQVARTNGTPKPHPPLPKSDKDRAPSRKLSLGRLLDQDTNSAVDNCEEKHCRES